MGDKIYITDLDGKRLTYTIYDKFEVEENAVLGVAGLHAHLVDPLVGHGVAHGVQADGLVVGIYGAFQQRHGLHHVGMATNDVVYTLLQEPLCKVALLGIGLLLVLVAPVHEGDDGIGVQGAGTAYVGCEFMPIEAIDDIGCGGKDAVGAIGGAEQRYAHTVLLYDEGIAQLAIYAVAVSAYGGYTEAVGKVQRTLKAAFAAVEAVVVGCSEEVEPGIVDGMQVFVGGAELWIAAVGLATQRDLKVTDSEVGRANVVLHQREAVAVVVCAVGLASGIDLCLMLHEVAHKQ